MTDMLAKGTENGGVDAIVADSPNLKLPLDKGCNALTMAFRKESTLTNEFSKGVLRVIDNGDLERIQERTIGNFDACENDPYNSGSNPRLDNDSLWILIAGGVGVFILMVIIILLYCGFRYNTTRKKRAITYPCYLLPCC
uniref:Solute-binding protein family 3/N-terminal domain-containing protein n=1 Tax=Chenopodium quinoa TaxID=63459 RepID=A0A803M2J0_CHEQI